MEKPSTQFEALRWCVPTGAQAAQRFQWTMLLNVTITVAAICAAVLEAEIRWPMVGAVLLLGGLIAVVKLASHPWNQSAEPNVWLAEQGLGWKNRQGETQQLSRQQMRSFWIGLDDATQSAVPALCFVLEDGFLSQPVELHAPATPSAVEQWITSHWQLPRVQHLPEPKKIPLQLGVLYNVAEQSWQFIGSRVELEKLLAALGDIAQRITLPPLGAQPKEVWLACNEVDCSIQLAERCWIQDVCLAIPPARLLKLVEQARLLFTQSHEEEFLLSLVCDTGHHWRLIFRISTSENP
jgi:hypothetical protein